MKWTNQKLSFGIIILAICSFSLSGCASSLLTENPPASSSSSVSSASSAVSSVISSSTSSASSASSVSSGISSSSSVSSSSSSINPGLTFGLYSETVPISVTWDTDTKMFVWQDWGANAAVADVYIDPGEGTKSLRMRCTSTNLLNPWFGVGISVWPLTANRNLSAYYYLNFMYKGTNHFKVGVKDGFGDEAWLTDTQLYTYGCRTNGIWCSIKVPLTALPVDKNYINQYFMFVSDVGLGCKSNDIHYVDNIYYSEN